MTKEQIVTDQQAKWETHDWSPDTYTCRKCGAPISTGERCVSGIVSVGVAPDADDIIVRLRRAYDETGNSLLRDAMIAIVEARRSADMHDLEVKRIFALTDAEIHAEALAEFGSEEAVSAVAEDLRRKMLATVDAHISAQVPTPDPAVMRDYIVKLTAFFIDNPKWVALAEEARGYVASPMAGSDG